MANINNKKNATLNRVQMLKDSNSNMEYLSIDGIPCGYMGSVSEAGREAGIRCIQRLWITATRRDMTLFVRLCLRLSLRLT